MTVEYEDNFLDAGELWEFAHKLKRLLSEEYFDEQPLLSRSDDPETGIKTEGPI